MTAPAPPPGAIWSGLVHLPGTDEEEDAYHAAVLTEPGLTLSVLVYHHGDGCWMPAPWRDPWAREALRRAWQALEYAPARP